MNTKDHEIHTVYFENSGHRAMLTIQESSIDKLLDMMLDKVCVTMVTREDYYRDLPGEIEHINRVDIMEESITVGRCEEYAIN